MSNPVKIVVTAETAEAAAKLQDFVKSSSEGLRTMSSSAGHAASSLGSNRMAMMELGHVARSTGESLAFGMNPLKVLALESPRIVQSMTMMGVSLAAMIPYVLAAAAAGGVFALEWYAVVGHLEDSTKKAEEFVQAMEKVPAVLEKIQTLQRAGLIGNALAKELSDQVTQRGKKKYVKSDGTLTDSPTEQIEEQTPDASSLYGGPPSMHTWMRTRQLPEATQDQLTKDADSRLPQISKAQAEDIEKNKELEKKARDENLLGIEKEKAAIHEKFERQRREILETAKLAGAPLTVSGVRDPDVDKRAAAAIADLNGAEQKEIATAEKKIQDERARQQEQSAGKIRTQEKESARQDLQNVEDEITADQDKAGNQRGELIKEEYQKRIDAAQRAYFSGEVSEAEYTHLVQEAQHKRADGEKAYNVELERTAQLKKQIAQYEAEAKLHAIDQNQLMTGTEKDRASIPIWQNQSASIDTEISGPKGLDSIIAKNPSDSQAALEAQQKKNELLVQQGDIQRKIYAAQHADDFGAQLGIVAARLRDVGTLAQQTAQAFGSAWTTATNSISNGITGLVMGTRTWAQALREIYTSIVTDIVQSIVHMAVQWIMQHAIMAAYSAIFGTTQTVQSATTETAKTVATTTGVTARLGIVAAGEAAATGIVAASAMAQVSSYAAVAGAGAAAAMADIPYVGPELAIASMAEVLAAVLGLCLPIAAFAEGGPVVGPGSGTSDSMLARVSHGEFIVRAAAVQQFGVGNLHAINRGVFAAGSGGSPSSGGSQKNVSIYPFTDPRQMANHMERDSAHEKWVVDVMHRNIHKFR